MKEKQVNQEAPTDVTTQNENSANSQAISKFRAFFFSILHRQID
jgi:hypothetical protein